MKIATLATIEKIKGLKSSFAESVSISLADHSKFNSGVLAICRPNLDAVQLFGSSDFVGASKPFPIKKKSSRNSLTSPFVVWDDELKSSDYPIFPLKLTYNLSFFKTITSKHGDILEINENYVKVKEKNTNKIFHLESEKRLIGKTIEEVFANNDLTIPLNIKDEKFTDIFIAATEIDDVVHPFISDVDVLFFTEPHKRKKPQKYNSEDSQHRENFANDMFLSSKKCKQNSYLRNTMPADEVEQKTLFTTNSFSGFFTKYSQRMRYWLNRSMNKSGEDKKNPIQHGPRIDYEEKEQGPNKFIFPAIMDDEVIWIFLPDKVHTVISLKGKEKILGFIRIFEKIKAYNFVPHPLWQQQLENFDPEILNKVTHSLLEKLQTIEWFKHLLENKDLEIEDWRSQYMEDEQTSSDKKRTADPVELEEPESKIPRQSY